MDGHLEVKVVGCTKLKDTNWITRKNSYVSLLYDNSIFSTGKNGHKNPTFKEKFSFSVIEPLREISIQVWECKIFSTSDKFIGSAKIHLQKVLAEGFDDRSWNIINNSGRSAGEVSLIMRYTKSLTPAAPPHAVLPTPHVALYPPPPPVPNHTSVTTYWTHSTNYPSYQYPPPPQQYAAPYNSAYPPPPYYPPGINPGVYPPP